MTRKDTFPSLRSTGSVAYTMVSIESQVKGETNAGHVSPESSEISVWVHCSQFFENRPRFLHRCDLGWINGVAKEQLVTKICQHRPNGCAGQTLTSSSSRMALI
jgi:hypothetical protein